MKAETPALDVAEMRRQLGDDDELIRDVVDLFLADHVDILGAMRAAIPAGDFEQVQRVAHTIKGAASNLSAPGVVGAADALEELCERRNGALIVPAFHRLTSEVERLTAALAELRTGWTQ
jgi:two-component system sensor histidine kinase/response regulator